MLAIRESLCDRLRHSRKSAGLTQKQLEHLSGVLQNTISRIEAGAFAEISTGTLTKLALALEVSTDYLLGLKDEPD